MTGSLFDTSDLSPSCTASAGFALRPYQKDCIGAVLAAKARGLRRVMYQAPTGCGKTLIFGGIIRALHDDKRPALVIAHRQELLTQAAASIGATGALRASVEAAERKADAGADVIVASVQTIGRRGSRRLDWLARVGPSVIVIDECHHAPAATYGEALERFGAFDDRTYVVGCTATPKRLDRVGLHGVRGAIFEEAVFEYSIRQAIKDGWLCKVRGYRVTTDKCLDTIEQTGGDFNAGALASLIDDESRTSRAVKHWAEVAQGRPTIVFCASVDHARHAAEAFGAAGARAAYVSGSTPTDERRATLEAFKAGKLDVLTNVEVLTEGFDHPPTACIVALRPTRSWGLYVQMIGRGTRICPGKDDLIVIDVVDNCQRHSLASVPAILDLPADLDLGGASLEEAAEMIEELGARAACLAAYKPKTFKDLETMLQQVDLFANAEPDEVVSEASPLNWLKAGEGDYMLDCGRGRFARVSEDQIGGKRLILTFPGLGTFSRVRQMPLANADEDIAQAEALRRADVIVRREFPDAGALMLRRSKWRAEPPTDGQVAALRRFGVDPAVIAHLNKGAASGLITQHIRSLSQGSGERRGGRA